MDINLEQVFGDVGSLPAMVTHICDFDELIVAQPPMVTSPAGPTVVSLGFLQPSTGSVGCPSVLPTVPAVSTPEKSLLLGSAEGWSVDREGVGVAIYLRLPWPLVRRLRLLRMVNRTQLGGTRTSMTCLVRGHLISTRIVRTPALRTVAAGHPGVSIPDDVV